MPTPQLSRPAARGFTLTELMAVVAVLGLLAILALPRADTVRTDGLRAACHVDRAEIKLQVQLWLRANGSLPATDLSDIGADPAYFPEGLPVCPRDGTPYTLDAAGDVVGHDHL